MTLAEQDLPRAGTEARVVAPLGRRSALRAALAKHWTPLSDTVACDLRALALFRITMGITLVVDLATRSADLRAHYTDFGVLPRAALFEQYSMFGRLSLHNLAGHPWFEALLIGVHMLFGALLVLGYRTRLMTGLCWLLLVSLQNRNPLVGNSGDVLFRMLLLWGIFLPLGGVWSLDRAHNPHTERPNRVLSVATVAVLGQLFVEYFFAALHKSGPAWVHGKAVWRALNMEQFATQSGLWFRESFDWSLEPLTHAVWWFEFLAPIFFFCPLFFPQIRLFLFGALALMHLSFHLLLGLGIFPFICISGLMTLLPAQFFDWVAHRRSRMPPWALQRLRTIQQWVPLPREPHRTYQPSVMGAILVIGLFALVLFWNISTIAPRTVRIPTPLKFIGQALRVDQRWNMFAEPRRKDGWLVVPGQFADHSIRDVYTDARYPVSWTRPELISATFQSKRWRKYLSNIQDGKNQRRLIDYARYLCRVNNERRSEKQRLLELEIYLMMEFITDFERKPTEKVSLLKHRC